MRMMPAMSSVRRIITDDTQSGTTWRSRIRGTEAPCSTTAAMKSLRAIDAVSARASRA